MKFPTGRYSAVDEHTMLGPGGKVVRPKSESAVLDSVLALLGEAGGPHGYLRLKQAMIALEALREQVSEGYHRNPMLVTYNPPSAPIITHDVQAILYRHAENGKDYVHAFGGVEPGIKQGRDSVTLSGLAEATGVHAVVRHGGRIIELRHEGGAMLAEDI